MTRLAVFLLSLSVLFGCTSAELNSWGIPAVVSKDSEELKDLEVFQDSSDDSQPQVDNIFEGMSQETIERIEKFQDNLSVWKCGPYSSLSGDLQELTLTKGTLEDVELGGVFLGDLEIVAAFSVEGLDLRWDWEDYAIVLSPNNLARYYDFTMAKRDEDTGQRQTSSSLTWTCKKEK